MAGIGKMYALIDQLRRNVSKNMQDPISAIELGVNRLSEDFRQDPVNTVLNSSNLGGMVGMTKMANALRAPREDALRIAQENAVKMLGLPPNNTPMDRAKALGYIDDRLNEYRMSHTAPIKNAENYGAPLHEMNKAYPDDIYSSKARQYYGDGVPAIDAQSIAKISMYRNKPNEMVRAYRAVPSNASNYLNHGDWITLSENYAKQHGEGLGDYKIIEQKIPVKSAYTDANSINEFGYDRTQEFADELASIPVIRAQGKPERSRFAAFDPARVNENDLLGRIDPRLNGLMAIGAAGGAGAYGYMKDKK